MLGKDWIKLIIKQFSFTAIVINHLSIYLQTKDTI